MEILTDIATKIGFDWRLALTSLVNFLILFFLLVKFALPAIKKNIEERTAKIKEGLRMREEADKIVDQAKLDAKEINIAANQKSLDIISASENNAKNILTEANTKKSEIVRQAEELKDEAKNAGMKEAENLLKKDISKIITAISENAFSTKISTDLNSEFISKVFK